MKVTVDVRQIDRFATDFYHFLEEKSHKNTFSICQNCWRECRRHFLRLQHLSWQSIYVFEAHPGIFHAICGGKWIAEAGLQIFFNVYVKPHEMEKWLFLV